jgi:hypothetical protein
VAVFDEKVTVVDEKVIEKMGQKYFLKLQSIV